MGLFSLPKIERLSKKKSIQELFNKGSSFYLYPFKVIYLPGSTAQSANQVIFSVSKRNFKKAVDRNYFKRVLRECYRLNKDQLIQVLDKKYCFMFFYQTNEKLPYSEIEEKTKHLFEKFGKTIQQEQQSI